ncbi:MAG: glycine dehydrogenase, partial [Kordiimonadaceae bacterium]|nr:glycine dehydrogenase [Kordiimonadaceae bacterium]
MRYLPLTDDDRAEMRAKIGISQIDELFKDVPKADLNPAIDLPCYKSEMEVERHLSKLANKNMAAGSVPFFVGAGAYKHHVPSTVDHMIQRG